MVTAFLPKAACTFHSVFKELKVAQHFKIVGTICVYMCVDTCTCMWFWQDFVPDGSGTRYELDHKRLYMS